MKPYFTKRCFAYLIDVIIVLISSVIITGLIPTSQKAISISENIVDLTTGITESKISKQEYNVTLQDLNYEFTRETLLISLINIVIYILYFVVYPVYNNGQTVGKRIQRIKITGKSKEEVTTNKLLIRAFILYGLAINIISLILMLIINKNSFILINNALSYLHYLILIIILFMVSFSKNGKGLHDILANTMVINEEE